MDTIVFLKDICRSFKLDKKSTRIFIKIIYPIFIHEEFQKRLSAPYYHHGNITIGEHILHDAIMVYKLCLKNKFNSLWTKRAILIAMFHDLYDSPWKEVNPKAHFVNYHAFIHPVEAIVNAITWFPEYFMTLEDSKVIIDGVIHHMYPCPVRAISDVDWELSNQYAFDCLHEKYKKIIIQSLRPNFFRNLNLRKSYYIEGRLLVKVDKIITIKKDLKGKKVLKEIKNMFIVMRTAIFRKLF